MDERQSSFDLGRNTYESWPWMYGYQWVSVFEKVKEVGVEQAKPEILMLSNWCSIYATPEEQEQLESLTEGDWRDLHRMLAICMRIADRQNAWKFKLVPEGEATLDDEPVAQVR